LNLGVGAELGIYKRMVVNGTKKDHWLVDQSLAMPMTLTLYYNGEQIISYDPKKVDRKIFDPLRKSTDKWWVTGFNPDHQDVKASQLKAIYTVDFSGKQDLYKYFIKSKDYLNNKSKWSISKDNKYKLIFEFK